MTAAALMLASMGASVAVAAAALGIGLLVDRGRLAARLRDRAWSAGLTAPLLPPLLAGLMLLTPPPVRETEPAAVFVSEDSAPRGAESSRPADGGPAPLDLDLLARGALAVAALAALARLAFLAARVSRLRKITRTAEPAGLAQAGAVAEAALALGVAPPRVRIGPGTGEALLTGVLRPCLILPVDMAAELDEPTQRAVLTHELTHLKRGDHLALAWEETLMILLAFNPLMAVLRARRSAAREEACDEAALSGASAPARQAYAGALLDAWRRRLPDHPHAPVLTFGGAARGLARRRLRAVLTPAPAPSRFGRAAAAAAGGLILALASGAGLALAGVRPAVDAVDADARLPIVSRQWAWTSAAMTPVYKAVWPAACGFGVDQQGLYVQAGEGCAPSGGSQPRIVTLAGIQPEAAPRDAFAAVEAACASGRPVEVVYRLDGERHTATVACTEPARRPQDPVRLTVALSYDPVTVEAGDRLELTLAGSAGESVTTRGLNVPLAPGAGLPARVFADLNDPVIPARGEPPRPFLLDGVIVGRDGRIRARAAPLAVKVGHAPVEASAHFRAAARAGGTGGVAGPARPEPTAAEYQRMCASNDPSDEGFCVGVVFGVLSSSQGAPGACPPRNPDGHWDAGVIGARSRAAIASLAPAQGASAADLARAGLRRAFPCGGKD